MKSKHSFFVFGGNVRYLWSPLEYLLAPRRRQPRPVFIVAVSTGILITFVFLPLAGGLMYNFTCITRCQQSVMEPSAFVPPNGHLS